MTSQYYGQAAIKATNMQHNGEYNSPRAAWGKAVEVVFPDSPSSQDKGCPRCAYLGLCEDGLVKGVPRGNYTNSEDNKRYAVNAVSELRKNPNLTSEELWERVAPKGKTENSQMDVVLALWKNNLIV